MIEARAERPRLSVVIAATESTEAVARCLESLARDKPEDVEIVVVAGRDRIKPCGFGSIFIRASQGAEAPRLRRLGADCARGDLIAFAEDSCVYGAGWSAAWLSVFESSSVLAATGPVERARPASLVDWAVYFCEYASFFRLVDAGRLAGNNFAVRKEVVAENDEDIHEYEIQNHIAVAGRAAVAGASARFARRFRFGEALRDRFRFGREFGGLAATRSRSGPRRIWRAGSPAILAVQVGRLLRTVWASPILWKPFLRAWPVTLTLLAFWSVGESIGRAAVKWNIGANGAATDRPIEEATTRL